MGLCLVTGATGYVGGRLAPRLLAAGHRVRCLTRGRDRLRGVPWAGLVETVQADVLDLETLPGALDGVDVAYYLVHSLGSPSFEDIDRRAAGNFADAARAAGVRRIVYLGGPEPDTGDVSPHLRSRGEVGRILASRGVPTVVLRAGVIIGAGSASFEMLRYLTERLPVMVTPRWVGSRIQPIAIGDVLHYLVGWAAVPDEVHRGFDLGGPDVLTYGEMMRRYAKIAGLPQRLILPVRPLTPRLSALWVGLVTPVPSGIARPLVRSLTHDAVAREHDIARYTPDPAAGLTDFDTAVRLALARVGDAAAETRRSTSAWIDAPAEPMPTDPAWSGGTIYIDERERAVAAPVDVLWSVIVSVGGQTGWYSPRLAWWVRGRLDQLVGGVGLRRGQRTAHELRVGAALDFWRVEAIEAGRLLRLHAEMRLPGRAWLELHAVPNGTRSRYEQRALFLPKGITGLLYWKAISPAHALVFGGMARNIARAAERLARSRPDRRTAIESGTPGSLLA
jgi:uncharacterized protein YbjT (DUF2867 family)